MNLKGIGPKKKKILKKHFGSIENLKIASLDDLKKLNLFQKKFLKKYMNIFIAFKNS